MRVKTLVCVYFPPRHQAFEAAAGSLHIPPYFFVVDVIDVAHHIECALYLCSLVAGLAGFSDVVSSTRRVL
jgi:hypothetical protein